MHGSYLIIPVNMTPTQQLVYLDRPVTPTEVCKGVGGKVKVIPSFDTISYDGKVQLCYAFCDRDGEYRELPPNLLASYLWVQALIRRYGLHYDHAVPEDVILGSLVILAGDSEFLEAL